MGLRRRRPKLIEMAILLVLPGAEGCKACVPLEILHHGDAALIPGPGEILVLEGVGGRRGDKGAPSRVGKRLAISPLHVATSIFG